MNDPGFILGLNPCVGGMNHHDPCAVLRIPDGTLLGVEEERFCGEKHAPGRFPAQAVKWCLEAAGIGIAQVGLVTVGFEPDHMPTRMAVEIASALRHTGLIQVWDSVRKGSPVPAPDARTALAKGMATLLEIQSRLDRAPRQRMESILRQQLMSMGTPPPLRFFPHHLCHAASAYHLCNPHKAALAVVVDGVGESSSASLWLMDPSGEHRLVEEIPMPNSLGYFYAAATAYLGFTPWMNEGKLMALAAHGTADPDLDAALEQLQGPGIPWDFSAFLDGVTHRGLMLDVQASNTLFQSRLGSLPAGGDPFQVPHARNFAHAVQQLLEEKVIALIRRGIERTGIHDLCAAGGVFLNCRMNGRLIRMPEIASFMVQPVAGDAGVALGAVLLGVDPGTTHPPELFQPHMGPRYSREEAGQALRAAGLHAETIPDAIDAVANRLARGQIGLWFDGAMELGPRALGARSIIADPRDAEIARIINTRIKGRETWRPFGCSVLAEQAENIMELPEGGTPYMIIACQVHPAWRQRIPGVVHVDGSTRPQTVIAAHQPNYHRLISRFATLTGVPLIINTSMNGPGQPLVRTPEEAITLFTHTPVDFMFLEGILVTRSTTRPLCQLKH